MTELAPTQIKESREEMEAAFDKFSKEQALIKKRQLVLFYLDNPESYIRDLKKELHYLKTGEWLE